MRLLLDECVPKRLARLLAPHEVQTVQQAGWNGLKNGNLLSRAAESFEIFVTVDQGIRYQQNLRNHDICVVALAARTNDIRDLEPLVPRLLEAIKSARPGKVLRGVA
jgi:predicted nuclease of predicted toxin-antitoxin system